MSAETTPTPSASLILLSMTPEQSLVTLLLTRTSKASFMPNALVFPGGGVEAQDLIQAQEQLDQNIRFPAWSAWGFKSEHEALAQRICALRECDEEAGAMITPSLDQTILPCLGRWLTPTRLPKRFNTSFWLGILDSPLSISPDHKEVTEGAWRAPHAVLNAYTQESLELAPPTIRLLSDLNLLSQHHQLRTWWNLPKKRRLSIIGEQLAGKPSTIPICPDLVKFETKNELRLCFPGDEGYHNPSQQYEPNPAQPNHLWRPIDQPKSPWRMRFVNRSTESKKNTSLHS